MLKLDFNERADSVPKWLQGFAVDTSQLWKYPNRVEIEALIAQTLNTEKENIFLSNGGDESIDLLFKTCKLTKQSILLPLPAFSQYTHQLRIWEIEHKTVESHDDLTIHLEKTALNLKSNQWLILTRPNNPTGECIGEADLINLIETAQNTQTKIFLDEAYVEFFLENSQINYALKYDHVISLRTFSKAYGLAGARLGYLIGSEKLINQFKKFAPPFNVNQVSLQLAKTALQNTSEVQRYCKVIAINRQLVLNFLQSCQIEVFDGKGNFLLFKLSPKKKVLLSLYLGKQGIQIKTQLEGLTDCVRITIPENITLLFIALQTVFKPEIIGFDMDGVLIDTSQSYDMCILETVEYFTKKQLNVDNILELRSKGGFNNDWDLTQGLIQQMGLNIEMNEIITQFQKYYLTYKNNETNLLQGQELFNKDYSTAIITGRPKAEALDGIEQLGIEPDYIISADDVNNQKPSPEGINGLKNTSNKSRMWFCGDTVDDMQAGLTGNCLCIGIATDSENTENLYQAGADFVLENINQLEELL
jgi:histidinol-phosphate aminotransferase